MSSDTQVSSSQVSFGKNIVIDPIKNLKRHDKGRAKAYAAYDTRNAEKQFIAIVTDALNVPRVSEIVVYESLMEVTFMRLVGSGVVNWTDGSQKFVLMYNDKVSDCLVKPGAFSDTTWRNPDVITYLVQPMAQMLKEMRDKRFSHGAIRADNIFYSSASKSKPVVLGDCLSTAVGLTQPAIYLPPHKAFADPIGRGVGSSKDDMYAFGVSLYMLLRKTDEVRGMNDHEIIHRKLDMGTYGALIGKERYQVTFQELLRGLLHDDEEQRWSVDELMDWIDGVRMTPLPPAKRKKANRPFAFANKRYLYAEQLAVDLHKYTDEIGKAIKDESLGLWIRKAVDDDALTTRFDKALERIEIMEESTAKKHYIVAQLETALFPGLAVHYKGRCFVHDGIGNMMARDAAKGEDLSFYADVLNISLLDHMVANSIVVHPDQTAALKLYDTCRGSLKKPKMGYGVDRCVYMLCHNASCLSPVFKNRFVHNGRATLKAFEALSSAGGQIALMVDKHVLAFFSVRFANFAERFLYDLTASDKDQQVAGNLHFMGALQKREGVESLPEMAKVFLDAMSGVYKVYKNRDLREKVKKAVERAADAGNLFEMSALLSNPNSQNADNKGFHVATLEYKALQKEYDQYNLKLAHKKSYGIVNGKEVATVVSWLVATAITVIVVLAFFSGNRIF